MANKIKITTTELKEQASRMDALNDRLDGVITQMNSALKKIDNSTCAKFSSNLIVKTAVLRGKMQNARNYLLIGAAIAKKCAESYTNADTVIRKNITDINTPEVQNSTASEQQVMTEEQIYNEQQAAIMEHMYANGERIDTSTLDHYITYTNANGKTIGFYEAKNGCTWYAIARYLQVNGDEKGLKFSKAGGNANNWVHSIDRSQFDVNPSSDTSVIKCNTIAVSTECDEGGLRSGKHVAYIEAVKDRYVYYTEGVYGTSESTWGYIRKITIEEFMRDYEYVISAK